jgi:hypothetical protein
MADEVIIEEYANLKKDPSSGEILQIPAELITTQVLDIAVASAAFNARTSFIRVQSKGTGFWYLIGGASPSATANTDGNSWLPADQFRDLAIRPGVDLKIDTAA